MSNDDETDPNRSRGGGDEETSNIAASFGKYSSSSSASSTSSSSSSCSSSSTTPVNDSAAADETESSIVEEIYADLIEDVTFGLILQTHRAAKLGYLQLVDPDSDSELDKQYEIYDDADVLGVFKSNANETTSTKSSSSYKNGQNSSSALLKYECVCPNCGRNLAAIRFAPHLEKCMGMGRNSSRIATRRIANGGGSGFGAMTDYELDQLIESTGMIPNPRYFEQFNKPAPPPAAPTPAPAPAAAPAAPHSSSESDLISIINAVATDANNIHPSSSCSSLIEIDVSSSSSGSSLHNHPSAHHHHHHPHQHPTTTNIAQTAAANTFKMPVAKKKKLNNSRSMATSSAATSSQNTRSASGQSSSSTSYGSIFSNK